jgi:hypothetical protein
MLDLLSKCVAYFAKAKEMLMSSYLRLAADAGDQYLAALAESQEYFLKSVSPLAWSVANGAAVPGYSVGMSTPHELTDASFAFAEKLLQQQKDFIQKLVAVTRSGRLPRKDAEGERAPVSVVPTKDSKSEPTAIPPAAHDRPGGSHRSSSRRAADERIAVGKRPSAQPTTLAPKKSRKSGR